MNNGVFITGTGTDVGKTYISALIVKKLHEQGINIGYFKSAMSGNIKDKNGKLMPGDAVFVKDFSNIAQPLAEMCPYVYETAVSPHLASQIEGNPVELERVSSAYGYVCGKYNFVVFEGSGGIICPIRCDEEKIFLIDIIKLSKLPCIIVSDTALGSINRLVLTYEYMKLRDVPIIGIIFNNYNDKDIMEKDNVKMCEILTGLPVLAKVKPEDKDIDINKKFWMKGR